MAKIMVYDPDTDQIYTEWRRRKTTRMPIFLRQDVYSPGNSVRSGRSTVFWTTTTAMEAWNTATRRTYGAAIPVGYAFKRIWEGGHGLQGARALRRRLL